MYQGTAVSPGIALGKALIVEHKELIIEKQGIISVEEELSKFDKAIEKSIEQLKKIKDKALIELGEDKASIFAAHLMILDDPELISSTKDKITKESLNAEFAFKEIIDNFIVIFEAMDNEYMRERISDIKDVSGRVLRNLLNETIIDLATLEEEVILVAHDLTPSDTASMNKHKVLGFLTDIGGRTSHTAIMARTLEVPAVVGLRDISKKVKNGDFIVFNGDTGEVIVNPEEETIEEYKMLKLDYEKVKKELAALIGEQSVSIDGKKVELAGNIGTPNDIEGLMNNDAEGVGLYRTEFLYMNRTNFPTEDEQFISYKAVLESMNSKPTVIRTLDIGGDKSLPYLKIEEEMNPFLGYRAIRICLDKKDIFITQLRALLRASNYGNLRIMFPMISSLEELLQAKDIIKEVKADLDKEGIKYSKDIQIGIMIEIPAAAIISDILAKHVDFFSIGTNDLIQYTTAVDRMNEKIHHLYNPFNPGVLRLIKMTIDNGHKEGIWVGMCGEMAGDQKLIPILLGMGIDELSMSPISILPARKLIRSLKYVDTKKIAEKVIGLASAEEIKKYINTCFD